MRGKIKKMHEEAKKDNDGMYNMDYKDCVNFSLEIAVDCMDSGKKSELVEALRNIANTIEKTPGEKLPAWFKDEESIIQWWACN